MWPFQIEWTSGPQKVAVKGDIVVCFFLGVIRAAAYHVVARSRNAAMRPERGRRVGRPVEGAQVKTARIRRWYGKKSVF